MQYDLLIIKLSTLAGALTTISIFLYKIYVFLKKKYNSHVLKQQEQVKEITKEVINSLIPVMINSESKKVKEDLTVRKQEYANDISDLVVNKIHNNFSEIKDELTELKKLDNAQNAQISLLMKGNVHMLRQRIEDIYYEYCDNKQIPRFALEDLEELYADYEKSKGNHHIKKLYLRMKDWEVTDEKPRYDR